MLACAFAAAVLFSAQETILLDTDPGRFTDDNVAIAMLARSGKVKIQGVTVVAGNVWANEGLRNARATLQLLDIEAPVHLGAQQPLVHTVEMSRKEQPLEFAGAFALRKPKVEIETAVDYLITMLEQQGPLTVLAIGPLTNLAQALAKKPSIASRIKRLVIMGGNVRVAGNSNKTAEFNFWFDPEAARAVLRSPIREKILFGLDICNKAVYGRKEFDAIANGASPVAKLYRENFGYQYPGFLKNKNAKGYLWDELAAAYLIDPSVVTRFEDLYLDVDTTFGPRYGSVQVLSQAPVAGSTKVKVMLDVDYKKAMFLYCDILK
jgi:inosine-uridine nucleoside N-ribohydrolase